MKITVYGAPATQGSHKKGNRGQIIHDSKNTMPWREAVKQAVMIAYPVGARPDPILHRGPVGVVITFSLKRPQRPKHPVWPIAKMDLEKLCRSTLDALTEMGVFEDDGYVVKQDLVKRYCGGESALALPGAVVEVFEVR